MRPLLLGDVDLHLSGEGRHERLWDVLGAHPGDDGTVFAVWAPNAREVRVSGDFNGWDGQTDPMLPRGRTGVWETVVATAAPGHRYKFEILGPDDRWRLKADPMALHTENPPATASVVYSSDYEWSDAAWLADRQGWRAHERPMSVDEVHLGSWRGWRSYRAPADEIVAALSAG